MTSVDSLLQAASAVLTRETGKRVGLVDPVVLESENTVIRASVSPSHDDLPATVVVKHVTDDEFDRPDHTGPSSRFLNEWASLEFLTGIDDSIAPKLVAADRRHQLTIVEDLGDLATLESLLSGHQPAMALNGLETAGRLLGRLHAGSRSLEREFSSIQNRLGTRSPLSDSTIDQRERRDVFLATLASMRIAPGRRFWDEIVTLETLVLEDSPFRSLIHADAGPHNVLISGDCSRLIDFEFATYGNSLCDAVGARLGFPQTMSVGQVPATAVEMLEHAYRESLLTGVPQGEDDGLFRRHLTAACGHWALNRWAYGWRDHLGAIRDAERPPAGVVRAMTGVWLVIDGFVTAAQEFGEFQVVADALERFRDAATQRWPELGPGLVYPALRNL
jgi:hypothetical protein